MGIDDINLPTLDVDRLLWLVAWFFASRGRQ
jgi:hypothetical protein